MTLARFRPVAVMFIRFSLATLALLTAFFSAVLPSAQADTLVYQLTSLPNANAVVYADNLNNTLTDTLSGTITLSSTQSVLGTWNSTDVTQIESPNAPITLTYNLSMSNSGVSDNNITGSQDLATLINNGFIQGLGLTVTASGLFMPNPNVSGGQVELQDAGGIIAPYPVVQLTWNGNFVAFGEQNNITGANAQILAEPSSVPPVSSLYGSGAAWQIAAVVPEPSTMVLGALGLLGLGFVSLLKKFRRA